MKRKKILITGSSNGIGRAIALELANPDNHLILTWNKDIDGAKETAKLAEEKGSKIEIYNLHLDDEKGVFNGGLAQCLPDLILVFVSWGSIECSDSSKKARLYKLSGLMLFHTHGSKRHRRDRHAYSLLPAFCFKTEVEWY